MRRQLDMLALALTVGIVLGMIRNQVLNAQQASPAPTNEGTYKLISRKLPDGTMQRPLEIMGLLTYPKSHRNFNVVWKDATGKIFSYSLASTYQLTPTEYPETLPSASSTIKSVVRTSSTTSRGRPKAYP